MVMEQIVIVGCMFPNTVFKENKSQTVGRLDFKIRVADPVTALTLLTFFPTNPKASSVF